MNLTIVLGTLLAFELVGDITYKIFYRMVSRNKYKVGDIVWVKNNGSLEPAEITCITWKCFCRSESIAKPKYDIMLLGGGWEYREIEQSEILCKFKGKVEAVNE